MGSSDRDARIGVFGSANADLVVTVDRTPSPGETVTGRSFTTVPGGKGANQAIAAARAGGRVRMAGAVGTDGYGQQLLETLTEAGVDTRAVQRRADVMTGTAHIRVDGAGENSIVVVPGANGTLHEPTSDQLAALDGVDLLLLQLELPMSAVVTAAVAARERGVRVVLTPAPAVDLPETLLDAVDLLIPNEQEARLLAGTGDPEAAGAALARRVDDVVVTLGARGSLWCRRGRDPVGVAGRVVPVRDTTGAGDTFAGALAVALVEGRQMPEALAWASAAAALSVQAAGASSSMPARSAIDALASDPREAGHFRHDR